MIIFWIDDAWYSTKYRWPLISFTYLIYHRCYDGFFGNNVIFVCKKKISSCQLFFGQALVPNRLDWSAFDAVLPGFHLSLVIFGLGAMQYLCQHYNQCNAILALHQNTLQEEEARGKNLERRDCHKASESTLFVCVWTQLRSRAILMSAVQCYTAQCSAIRVAEVWSILHCAALNYSVATAAWGKNLQRSDCHKASVCR